VNLQEAYNAHIAVSYRHDSKSLPNAYVFGESHPMPVCDAQDTVAAVFDNGILPDPVVCPVDRTACDRCAQCMWHPAFNRTPEGTAYRNGGVQLYFAESTVDVQTDTGYLTFTRSEYDMFVALMCDAGVDNLRRAIRFRRAQEA
jgi:hypothetical protein